jgi:serine/threonine protein kinase
MAQADLEVVARRICQERRLQFVSRVGEGTFKQTFHVLDQGDQPVALKLYKSAISSPREQREVSAMLRCNHPNIARLLSVDEYDYEEMHLVTLTEEYLEGGTLTDKGNITRAECLSIGSLLIDAIGHTAGLGLVHRDIKPDNIMFRKDGTTPVLTDFGVARDLLDSSLTPTWAPRGPGTPFFASPEQLNNQKHLIDWRSDQFGLGVSLSYVTLGLHPYLPSSAAEHTVVDLVAGRNGPTEEFSVDTKAIGLPTLEKMVATWPVQRYRTPSQLSNAWQSQERTA